MAVSPGVPPLPDPAIPLVDPATGRITPEWYRWFVNLVAFLTRVNAALP